MFCSVVKISFTYSGAYSHELIFPYLSLFAAITAPIQKSAHFYTYTTSARSTQLPKRSYRDEILTVLEQPLFLFLSTVTNSRKRFFELVYTFSLTLASRQANPVQGRIQGEGAGGAHPPPLEMSCGFLIQLVFCKKNYVQRQLNIGAPTPQLGRLILVRGLMGF